jgi:hypothetical protein
MQALLQILGVIVLIAAIAPVAMAGGRMIAAFMMGKDILLWMSITLIMMILLVAGGLLALRVVMPLLSGMLSGLLAPLASAALLLTPPWAIWLLGKRWIERRASGLQSSP